jgi:ribonucleoside-diphosphate reductase alpha chain
MSGMRTLVKQFSSCVLIEAQDSLKSISATTSSIVEYISRKAGIGIEAGHIRALNSSIRSGDVRHTGVTPFYRLFQSAVKSCCLRPDTYVEILKE